MTRMMSLSVLHFRVFHLPPFPACAGLPGLRSVKLHGSYPWLPRAVAQLAACSRLTELHLSDCKVAGADLTLLR